MDSKKDLLQFPRYTIMGKCVCLKSSSDAGASWASGSDTELEGHIRSR